MENTDTTKKIDYEGWQEVSGFGRAGRIFAKGDQRKLIEEGKEIFFFNTQKSGEQLKLKDIHLAPKGETKFNV